MKTTKSTKWKTVKARAKKSTKRVKAPSSPLGDGERAYMLRTCNADMTAYNAFMWPISGLVTCPDWDPTPRCGGGLHGLLFGEGGGGYLKWDADAKWLVVEVLKSEVVEVGGDKVKVPRGVVIFCGDRKGATELMVQLAPGKKVTGATVSAANYGTATAGDRGTATAGDRGTATAGYGGTATAGYGGTATAGESGTATAGYGGTATAGESGTATAGDRGTATAGECGTATAGECGTLSLRWWDGKRYRLAVFAVGEDGIEPNVPYQVDGKGKPVKVVK